MDARLSPEQRQLHDAASRLALNLGPAAVGDLDDGQRRERLEATLAQTGWRELRSGGLSEPVASGVEAAIVTTALARRSCDVAFLGPVLALDLLRRAGVDTDPSPITIAVSADLQRPAAIDGVTVSEPQLAIDAAGSPSAVVLVRSTSGHAIATVPVSKTATGVDLTRPIAHVEIGSQVALIDGAARLSDEDLVAWQSLAVALTAADLVGAMQGALDLAAEYAKVRRQYGSPIGSYQAVQHMLAEAAALTEGASSATVHAAWAVDSLPPTEARQAAAVAKAYASRAARTVCETAIQVHGGIGNTWECMAHVFLRRTLLATELFGGASAQISLLNHERWGAQHGLR